MGGDPRGRFLLGSKFAKNVHGAIRPRNSYAPNLALSKW
jgi:hypothetical protein